MLRHQAGLRENRRVELRFDHHQRTKALWQAAENGCSVCSALARQLKRDRFALEEDQPIDLQAALASICGREWKRGYYSLDFLLDGRWMRTFALRPRTRRWGLRKKGQHSAHMRSKEVFKLTQNWVSRCKCANLKQEWYPDRLLDLEEVKCAIGSGDEATSKTRIRLLENSADWKVEETEKAKDNRNRKEMMVRGIALEDLPPTFRDAVVFASRLEGVRYIWIDALCIIQENEEDDDGLHAEDWKTQSALMDKVYHESYLNISATSASNPAGGLFRSRNPDLLQEDEVKLNVQGLLELDEDEDEEREGSLKKRKKHVKKCSVVDVSLWDDLVEDAPLNKRAWAYQERLLAPRVVHFCSDQVAWECSERCCTERYPGGVPRLQLKSGVIVSEDRLKDVDPEREGEMFQSTSADGFEDPEKYLPKLHAYELWKRVVELYSQKELSKKGDKLIALAGIAKFFFDTKLGLGRPVAQQGQHSYVAGMWREHLESQLLWRVEPYFEDGWTHNSARRHPLRAPSFSWAALDVPHGIAYGEYKDHDLLFQVEDVHMEYEDNKNKFGLLKGARCRLLLSARAIQIQLREIEPKFITPYGWWVNSSNEPPLRDMYTDIYLDSPASDSNIFEPGSRIYCMPAATDDGTMAQPLPDFICLLLQLTGEDEGHRTFKRIGLARLSNYEGMKFQQEIVGVQPEEMYLY
ncbi:Heterokaryon incompatibility protein [Lasiodiplodia theobromae]|uniref:Heterokaryon incompatibility protein n=1 Tax=Lasiodiplodia theobromae TaxID=45133 RepID=UPI0015C40763|nr:Heterokaryon incompatibility protein [Lasiodiplodia theobromae]KAF4538958.1 Heterokaryon incompatibility protein [Lasiodiplodia theobromae]